MRNLNVYIDYIGTPLYVGNITGHTWDDAGFSYAPSYLSAACSAPISIGLPLQSASFSPERTGAFFDGLLPEAYMRKCVSARLHAEEQDYPAILSGLGRDCLGAVRIVESSDEPAAAYGSSCETDSDSTHDISSGVHSSYRELSRTELSALAAGDADKCAELMVKSHLSLSGASAKTGLYYDESHDKWYLPLGGTTGTHIIKQSHVRLKHIIVNELLCMSTARRLGIDVPESFIINTGSEQSDNCILYATKRFDRTVIPGSPEIDGLRAPVRLHQEDFSQALGISSQNKYEQPGQHYLRDAFELLRAHSSNPEEDQLRLWKLCIFNYLVGNTDNHVKNIGILYSPDFKSVRLAPAYDLVSTAIYPSCRSDMSMNIGGERSINSISKDSFRREADLAGIDENAAMNEWAFMNESFTDALGDARKELVEQGYTCANDIYDRIQARPARL